jgi:hypothetical protein
VGEIIKLTIQPDLVETPLGLVEASLKLGLHSNLNMHPKLTGKNHIVLGSSVAVQLWTSWA